MLGYFCFSLSVALNSDATLSASTGRGDHLCVSLITNVRFHLAGPRSLIQNEFQQIYSLWNCDQHMYSQSIIFLFVLNGCFDTDTNWWDSLEKHVFLNILLLLLSYIAAIDILCQVMTYIHPKFQWQSSSFIFTSVLILKYLNFYNIQNGLGWTQIPSQSWADQLTCSKELLFVIRLNSGLDVVTEVGCSYEMLFISLQLKLGQKQCSHSLTAVLQVCFIIIWELNVDDFE